ncbi:hypothetical protein OH77DRAFT_1463847 [Trametes cingulata]|nr:hypothetical protein OH77DRAFT_1463847 [Trametes cingulata]
MQEPDAVQASTRLSGLIEFLSDPLVSSLFRTHPNELGTSSFNRPDEWGDWWDWAAEGTEDDRISGLEEPWLLLLRYYDSCLSSNDSEVPTVAAVSIPQVLQRLIWNASRLAVPRNPGQTIFSSVEGQYRVHLAQPSSADPPSLSSTGTLRGMSPKKAHEVAQMSELIGSILNLDPSIKHVVDVGAGQAYLSRVLRDRFGLHVLALDFSDVQTQGAAKRDAANLKGKRPFNEPPQGASSAQLTDHATDLRAQCGDTKSKAHHGSLTYVTAKINADTLRQATRDWVGSRRLAIDSSSPGRSFDDGCSTPVLLVALHACGSLTPDILRAFTAARKEEMSSTCWKPQAAVIVGCCYNMLRPEDFPLSRCMRSSRSTLTLTPNHLQLAAQVPSQWTRSEETLRNARLALRKIVWRALIQDVIDTNSIASASKSAAERSRGGRQHSEAPEERMRSEDRRHKRLGRLNDAAYVDWDTFARRVAEKIEVDEERLSRADRKAERRIEVFHVLRCIIGPVVESVLVLDRAIWAQEELQDMSLNVELVNLFDQASGSGRNVALVIRPRNSADACSEVAV